MTVNLTDEQPQVPCRHFFMPTFGVWLSYRRGGFGDLSFEKKIQEIQFYSCLVNEPPCIVRGQEMGGFQLC